MRKPPYGNYLIRDDAALLARLRAEVTAESPPAERRGTGITPARCAERSLEDR